MKAHQQEIKIGEIFSTGSAHHGNLRKYRVDHIHLGMAVCRVARGPNGKFYNSREVIEIPCDRLNYQSYYRRSKAREERHV